MPNIHIIMGPAGSGKSTYCKILQEHVAVAHRARFGRVLHVANLDPAADSVAMSYDPVFDIRDVINVEEVMEELQLGPNGALIYCMEYLLEQHMPWLQEQLESFNDDDVILLDCPGQLELYTHVPIMKTIIDRMRTWGYDGKMVSVFLIDAAFLIDASKFLSGSLLSLSAMIAMELPHVNVLSKCDLMSEKEIERILSQTSASQLWSREQDRQSLLPATVEEDFLSSNNRRSTTHDGEVNLSLEEKKRRGILEQRRRARGRLTDSLCQLLDDWQMVSFIALNVNDEDSLDHILATVDHAIQYGEDLEVRGAEGDDTNDDDDYGGGGE